uniref:Mimecan n=1 Tax=Paramormyrops kingsleyae TaxID=1676925 RepID=A0A3B3QUW2_9TELE
MITQRTLLFSFVFLPWVLSSLEQPFSFEEDTLFHDDARATEKEAADFPPADLPDDPFGNPAVGESSDLPTCLLCVCLTGSVYCEEVVPDMTSVPALPKETSYLYARYNKIKKITAKDFADILTLKRIDLTGNVITEIEDGAFSKLNQLEELTLAENRLVKLPMLPQKLSSFNANYNRLRTKGVKANIFKKLNKLEYLYLANNELEAVPQLPESLRIVHLQVSYPWLGPQSFKTILLVKNISNFKSNASQCNAMNQYSTCILQVPQIINRLSFGHLPLFQMASFLTIL